MSFKLSPYISINGTCLIGKINISTLKLIRYFGRPLNGDGYKVSGEYYFEGPDDSIFTVYDWKYGYDVWTPPSSKPMELNIGGNTQARRHLSDFTKWLEAFDDT
jgi:hypothetical protein